MSLRPPVLIRRGLHSAYGGPQTRSDLKRRFFACFPPSSKAISQLQDSASGTVRLKLPKDISSRIENHEPFEHARSRRPGNVNEKCIRDRVANRNDGLLHKYAITPSIRRKAVRKLIRKVALRDGQPFSYEDEGRFRNEAVSKTNRLSSDSKVTSQTTVVNKTRTPAKEEQDFEYAEHEIPRGEIAGRHGVQYEEPSSISGPVGLDNPHTALSRTEVKPKAGHVTEEIRHHQASARNDQKSVEDSGSTTGDVNTIDSMVADRVTKQEQRIEPGSMKTLHGEIMGEDSLDAWKKEMLYGTDEAEDLSQGNILGASERQQSEHDHHEALHHEVSRWRKNPLPSNETGPGNPQSAHRTPLATTPAVENNEGSTSEWTDTEDYHQNDTSIDFNLPSDAELISASESKPPAGNDDILHTDFDIQQSLQAAFARPSDHPRFQGLQQQSRMQGKNYDFWLERHGEKAYNWRLPLETLLEITSPMTGQEMLRLRRNYERERVLYDNHIPPADPRATDVPYPKVVTAQTLAQYIFDLSKLPHPDIWETPSHYQHGRIKRHPVRERILELLSTPKLQPLLSYEAFHAALRFLHRHNMFNEVRNVKLLMTELGLPPTINTYNISYWDLAKRKNLGSFTNMLWEMQRQGINADAWTWHAFVFCVDSNVVQDLIIEHMNRFEFMAFGAVKDSVIAYTIRPALEAHIRKGGDLDSFLTTTSERWGSGTWLKTPPADQMIQVLGWEGKIVDAIKLFFTLATSRSKAPSNHTFYRLLGICRGYDKPEAGIAVTHLFQHIWNMEPDEGAIHQLFSLFAVHGMANCCRVIWQVACVRGLVGRKLKTRMMNLVLKVPHEFADPFEHRWMRFQAYDSKIIGGRFFRYDWNVFWGDWLHHWQPETRNGLMVTVHNSLLESDLQMYGNWVFNGNLSALLHKAYQKDMAWRDIPEVLRGDISWMMKEAINIPLQPSPELLGTTDTAELSPPGFVQPVTNHVR